jgi:acyl dehydratase
MADAPPPSEAIVEDWLPTQAAFDRFAAASGDDNPIHVDADFSTRSRFGRTVAHGMLLYSRLWGMLSRHFPGMRHTEQTLMFPNPAFAGEELRFEARVARGEDGSLTVEVSAYRIADGEPVLLGRTALLPEAR